MILSLISVFILLAVFGVPLAVAIGMSGLVAIFLNSSIDLLIMPLRFFNAPNSFLLTAISLFILVGNILTEGKASSLLFEFASSLTGWTRGGLGYANILASMVFGGISGSSTADAAGLGLIEINEMVKRGYPPNWSASITVASSTLAIVIPPSVIMVIYAVTAEVSVVRCLLAGLLPGIVITIFLMFAWYIVVRKKKWSTRQPFNIRNVLINFKKSFLILIIPLGFLLGLIFGIFTPTEGASIITIYSLILCFFKYKTLKFNQLQKIIINTVCASGSIVFLICSSSVVSYILARENVPSLFAKTVLNLTSEPIIILVLINIFFLISGMFMEGIVIVLLCTPIFLPLFSSIGINPIHAGVIMITNLGIGLITPPIGICLFATSNVSKIPIEEIVRTILPFIAFMLISLTIINAFPWLSLAIPNMIK